jgi:hypothetical protein
LIFGEHLVGAPVTSNVGRHRGSAAMRRAKGRTWRDVLIYGKASRAAVRRRYRQYRAENGLPLRCDNPRCRFHSETLEWNGQALPLILDHINGVNRDNRPDNLRYLCPNCDALLDTRGGRNKGRVEMSSGGFSIKRAEGKRDYAMPAQPAHFSLTGFAARLSTSGRS